MAADPKFRRNLLLVALAHLVLVAALYCTGFFRTPPRTEEVIWLDGGSAGGGSPMAATSVDPPLPPLPPEPELVPPEPVPTIESVPRPPEPAPEPAKESDLVVPQATPAPTPKPATPKPATPKPSTPKPKPKATPKSAAKTMPKSTAKPTPKETAKAAPKGTPKTSPRPPGTAKATPSKKPKGTPGPARTELASNAPGSGAGPKSKGEGTGVGSGKGAGREGGGARANEFSWYHEMIHDRFHARWEQPTSILSSGAKYVTTLKLRIGKDGTILARQIVNESGNAVMDESVLTAANRVTQIDPLPAGLGAGGVYEISVNFKLDEAQR